MLLELQMQVLKLLLRTLLWLEHWWNQMRMSSLSKY